MATRDMVQVIRRLARGPIRLAMAGWALIALGLSTGCHGPRNKYVLPSGERQIRAVWVTRWDYKTPADIARVMDNCRAAGFNTVLFQVRGDGTVSYRSRFEPWAKEFGGADPGFDPLAVACEEAHKRKLAVHAWMNVLPGYRGDGPPKNPKQLFAARPDWFWRDAAGRHQPFGWYQSVNPCYPEVRRYLVDIAREIVSRYPVDGLHLDYIRFPNEWNESYPAGAAVPDYPRDPKTLALYKRATGLHPDQNKQRWDDWRTAQITQLVRDIRGMMIRENPRAWLTAAVGAEPEEHRRKHFQDSRRWIAERLVDGVYPMNYASDVGLYERRLANWAAGRPPVPVVTGIMFDKRDAGLVRDQVARTRRLGGHFAAFAYNSLFERTDRAGRPIVDNQSGSRASLRQQVLPQVRRMMGARLSMAESIDTESPNERPTPLVAASVAVGDDVFVGPPAPPKWLAMNGSFDAPK